MNTDRKLLIIIPAVTFLQVFISIYAISAGSIDPANSFTIEFLPDDKMLISSHLVIEEGEISDFLYELGLRDMSVKEGEELFAESLRNTFEDQMSEWRRFEGYPLHQVKLADIENYEVRGSSKNGYHHLVYNIELKSRHIMRMIDPSFYYESDDDREYMELLLQFPFPDIKITPQISTIDLAQGSMTYTIVLPHPIAIPPEELADIPGFLSATAYSATFLVLQDDAFIVRLEGSLISPPFPESEGMIEVTVTDDHRALIRAEMYLKKDELLRIYNADSEFDFVESLDVIKQQYGNLIESLIPDHLESSYEIEINESSDELEFVITIKLPDLVKVLDLKGPIDYAKIGDLTLFSLPLYNPFDPSSLPICEGVEIPPCDCTIVVIMPGRINNSNSFRVSRLPFSVDNKTVAFHLESGDYSYLTIRSDSASN